MNKELSINLCASMGFINREQFKRLRKAGVTSYHHNIETSRRNFPNICTSLTYDMKIETIKIAQEEGLCVCSGGIIGNMLTTSGSTIQSDIKMLREMGRITMAQKGTCCDSENCSTQAKCDCSDEPESCGHSASYCDSSVCD